MDSVHCSLQGQALPSAPQAQLYTAGHGSPHLTATARTKVWPDTRAAIYRLHIQEERVGGAAQHQNCPMGTSCIGQWLTEPALSPKCLKTRGH